MSSVPILPALTYLRALDTRDVVAAHRIAAAIGDVALKRSLIALLHRTMAMPTAVEVLDVYAATAGASRSGLLSTIAVGEHPFISAPPSPLRPALCVYADMGDPRTLLYEGITLDMLASLLLNVAGCIDDRVEDEETFLATGERIELHRLTGFPEQSPTP